MSRHPVQRAIALLVLSATVVAACSNDDESPTSSASESTTTTPEAGTTPTTEGGSFDGTVSIGFIEPAAGLLSELARGQTLGIGLAVDDIKAAGGIDGAEPVVSAVQEPLGGDPVPAIEELRGAGTSLLVGPVSSTGAIAARSALGEAIACSASATAPSVTAPDPDNPDTPSSVVRTALPDQNFVAALADELLTRFPDPAAGSLTIIARDDEYGQSVSSALSASLLARELPTTVLTYNPFAVIFESQVAAVVASNPGVVVMVSYEESTRLLGELLRAGVPGDTIVGLDGAARPNLGAAANASDPASADGVTVYATTGNLAFLQRAAAVEGATDLAFSAQAYDCVITFALAAIAAGSAEPAAVRAELSAVTADGVTCSSYADCIDLLAAGEDIDYDGPSGGIALNAQGDPAAGRITKLTSAGGALELTDTIDIDISQQERDLLLFASANLATQVQLSLRLLGFYDGPIDGIWSPELAASIAAFQTSVGLPPTGEWDAATDAALRAQLGDAAGLLSTSVADIQRALTDLGFYSGPIDGRWNTETIAAVKALQAVLGVPQTGIIDLATLQAIYAQGIESGTPPPTTPTNPPETTTPPPPPPTTPPPSTPGTIGVVLREQPEFSTLVSILDSSDLLLGLNPLKSYTLFAPTNDALVGVEPPTDSIELLRILAGHLVEGVLRPTDLGNGTQVKTVLGSTLEVTNDGTTITVGPATVVDPFDLVASNGVIHGIGTLLPAPDAQR